MYLGWCLDHEKHLVATITLGNFYQCARTIGRADGCHNLPCAGGGAKDKLRPLRAEGKKGRNEGAPVYTRRQVGEK